LKRKRPCFKRKKLPSYVRKGRDAFLAVWFFRYQQMTPIFIGKLVKPEAIDSEDVSQKQVNRWSSTIHPSSVCHDTAGSEGSSVCSC